MKSRTSKTTLIRCLAVLSITFTIIAASSGTASAQSKDGIERTPRPTLDVMTEPPPGVTYDGVSPRSLTQGYYPYRHYASLTPQPSGYTTNSCYRRTITSSTNGYLCRYLRNANSATFAKTSSWITNVSATDTTYGKTITTASGTYEGCRSYNTTQYRCDYYADNLWTKYTSTSTKNYYLDAFKKTKATAQCGLELGKFWKGTFNMDSFQRSCGAVQF